MKKSLTQKLTYVSISLFCSLFAKTLHADQYVAYAETSAYKTQTSIQTDTTKSKIQIYEDHEQMPEFPGGEKALLKFLEENTQYPEAAARDSIVGRVAVEFIITETGKIADPEVFRSLSPECDKEAIRVVNAMPRWIPGMQNGRAVKVYYTIAITFKPEKNHKPKKEDRHIDNKELLPEFPGGEEALAKYLGDNLRFPRKALKDSTEGQVLIKFDVTETGAITNKVVLNRLDPECDQEAYRLINAMPKWIPGMQNGKAIKVSHILPITFKPDSTSEIFTHADIMPQFPGGKTLLQFYYNRHIPYLSKSKTEKKKEKILVRFIVNRDGGISEIEVIQSVNPSLNRKLAHIIKYMPKWLPAWKEGRRVRVSMTSFISFAF